MFRSIHRVTLLGATAASSAVHVPVRNLALKSNKIYPFAPQLSAIVAATSGNFFSAYPEVCFYDMIMIRNDRNIIDLALLSIASRF
jgi:hypothetical protein